MYTNLFFIDMEIKIPQSLKIEHEDLHNEPERIQMLDEVEFILF
jgi:hypothetical protein